MNQKKRLSVKTVVLIGMFGCPGGRSGDLPDPGALCAAVL